VTTLQAVTLAIAMLGAVLGVLNTWHALDRDRVKLRVVPKTAFGVGPMVDPRVRLCIEVVNLSAFPITVSQVGFLQRGSKERLVLLRPILIDGGTFPRRLESRASVTVYFEPGTEQEESFTRVRCAFAQTDCGVLAKGTSSALKSLLRNARRGT